MLKSLEALPARFARAGKIKLGIKVQSRGGAEIPKDVPYFVIPEELRRVYGEKPTVMACRLPYDDPNQVFDASMQRWQGADLSVRCDEERYWARNHETGKVTEGACLKKPDAECECGAEPMGRLLLLIPGGHLGVYEIRLRGYHRIARLWEELRQYQETFGRLRGLPFLITRSPRMSTYRDKNGTAHTREIYPLSLKCEWSTLEQFAGVNRLLPQVTIEALPAAAPEPDDDAAGGPEEATILPGRGATVPEHVPLDKVLIPQVPAAGPGSTAEAVLGPQKETFPPRNDWDVSMLIAEAVKVFEIPALTYKAYLQAAFGALDTIDDIQIMDARENLEKARRSPKLKQALVAAIKRKAETQTVAR